MADCSQEFLLFNKSISLNKTELKLLRIARTAITKKIKKYFDSTPNCPKVYFKGQGSFSMGTIIRPSSGEFDIDIGVYLDGYTNWQDSWPKPETASQWLINALRNHTSHMPINKRNCIRILYSPLSFNNDVSYHVDLPIYCEYINFWDNKKCRIGINGEAQWSQKSNPINFTKWFFENCKKNDKDKNQLIRLVKYIKAWKDFVKGDSKFPSGMALTILLAENFEPNNRDDYAFKETVRKSYNNLYSLFSSQRIQSPVEPYNDVISKLTTKQKNNFKDCFEKLVDNAKLAVRENEKEKAMLIWRMYFGNRI